MSEILKITHVPKFAYWGGKANHRNWIVRWLPSEAGVYVEPFAGRANLFFLVKNLRDSFNFPNWHLNDIKTWEFLKEVARFDGHPFKLPRAKMKIKEWCIDKTKVDLLLTEPVISWQGGGGGWVFPSSNKYPKYHRMLRLASELLQGVKISSGIFETAHTI